MNTCAFIDASREESYGVVREMLDLKKAGGTRGVIVAGCLAERQKEKLLDELPGLDSVIGVFSRDDVAKAADINLALVPVTDGIMSRVGGTVMVKAALDLLGRAGGGAVRLPLVTANEAQRSVLRDDFRPESDIDVLVEFEPGARTGLAFFAMQDELSAILGRKVDLNTPGFLGKYFRDQVLREAEVQYDAT